MKKILSISFLLCLSVLTATAQSIYDYTVKDDAGKDVSLSTYKGKVLLIVNTATKCGFTPQYKDLQALLQAMVGGFCKDVFKELPGEFATEARQLLTLKLEHSVG